MQGSCLCGEVSFEIKGVIKDPAACHCSQCRKTSGHYWAGTSVDSENLVFKKDSTLRWFRSSDFAQRGFCNNCGSSLFYKMNDRDFYSVGVGTLDGETGAKIRAHIFTDDKGDYYEIEEGPEQLAQY